MIDLLAGAVIFAAGLYLVVLGISCFFLPDSAAGFLLGHASSGVLHYLELSLRLVVGASLIQKAPELPQPSLFTLFGWVVIITTTVLFFVPWRWHRAFTLKAVPRALRHIKLLGASSVTLGALLIACVAVGSAA